MSVLGSMHKEDFRDTNIHNIGFNGRPSEINTIIVLGGAERPERRERLLLTVTVRTRKPEYGASGPSIDRRKRETKKNYKLVP
jgi:hypothetical protein